LSERARVRRHYAPLCSKLVAAKSGSICIAVILVSDIGGGIVLSEVGEVVATGGGAGKQRNTVLTLAHAQTTLYTVTRRGVEL